MSWMNENINWVAWGLFIFFGIFVAAFFIRNQKAKSDENGQTEKNTLHSDIGIKKSQK